MPENTIKKKKVNPTIIFLLIFLFIFLLPCFLFAQDRKLEVEYPEIAGIKPETVTTGLPEYARYIFNFSIAIVGLVLLGTLIWGGLLYLTSAGQPVKLKEAKDRIVSAFLGAILLLSGYIILTTINPELRIVKLLPLEKPKLCKENKDCPRGFFCNKDEGKCEMVTSCSKDEDCPWAYKCIEGKCEKEKEVTTQIFWEIPMGQTLEEGLWEKERTNKLKALAISFEQFLTQEIKTGSPTFKRISDLNKYLKSLTEDCHCEELDGICQKAKNFSFPVGCVGDPCEKVRDKINNVLKINEKKSKELSSYKEKLIESKNVFEDEGRKFRNLKEEILEGCKQKGLLTRAEYYESVAAIEEQGGTTELKRLYLPAKDDPLVFYCAVGGTIYDEPYAPEEISSEELEKAARGFEFEPVDIVGEPLSCPAVIPVGEIIMDQVSAISYETNSSLEEVIYYIDKILAELTKMTELVSQCNESRCNVSCACISNPCYEPACGTPPARVNKCGIGKCTPPTPVTPNFCYFFCDSPCLQAVGGCHGEPCPRQKIIETVELIKIYEDEILGKEGQGGLLDGIKGSIEDVQPILKTEEDKADLATMRVGMQQCLSLGARTSITEKPEEEPFWMLLRCEMAIGNKGPDGNIITGCHPQNLYCCSNRPSASDIRGFPSALRKERPPTYTPLPEGPYSPLSYGFNNVPYFSQYDEKWRSKYFGCGTTIGAAGCGPTSIAMPLNFFGEETDPPSLADWVLENQYRVCGEGTASEACCKAVETFGKEEGIKCKELQGDIKAVLDELKNGKNTVAVVSGRGAPPYTGGGHYIVLTGIEKEWGQEFVYYNDPAYDPFRPERRPAQGRMPIDWFENQGIGAGCVIYK